MYVCNVCMYVCMYDMCVYMVWAYVIYVGIFCQLCFVMCVYMLSVYSCSFDTLCVFGKCMRVMYAFVCMFVFMWFTYDDLRARCVVYRVLCNARCVCMLCVHVMCACYACMWFMDACYVCTLCVSCMCVRLCYILCFYV